MLRKIGFENYKSFKNYTELEIKPITVLVGPNSAGKSSIINLLKILAQSILYPSELTLLNVRRGPFVSFYNLKEIFTNNKTNKDVKINCSITRKPVAEDDYHYPIFTNTMNLDFNIRSKIVNSARYVPLRIHYNQYTDANVEKGRLYFGERDYSKYSAKTIEVVNANNGFQLDIGKSIKKEFKKYIKLLNKDIFAQINKLIFQHGYLSISDLFDRLGKECYKIKVRELITINEIIELDHEDFVENFRDLLTSLFNDFINELTYDENYYRSFRETILNILEQGKKLDLKTLIKRINTYLLDNDFYDLSNTQVIVLIEILFKKVFLELISIKHTEVKEDLRLLNVKNSFTASLTPFNIVDPLRDKPKNYYDINDLAKYFSKIYDNDIFLLNKVNWITKYLFKSMGFNDYPNVKKVPSEEVYKIVLSNTNNSNSISNSGFGYSQLLPIAFHTVDSILANENQKNKSNNHFTLIEQPELHLHPNIQYKLAELFENYGMLQLDKDEKTFSRKDKRTSQLVIETHSEHLIRGFQVQVAKGNLSKDDIVIYYVSKDENGVSSLMEMELHDNGLFKSKWPKGFFDVTLEASLELLGD